MTADETFTCTRCGSTGSDPDGWNGEFEAGRLVAIICPACQTAEQNAEAEINAATIEYETNAFGQLIEKPKP